MIKRLKKSLDKRKFRRNLDYSDVIIASKLYIKIVSKKGYLTLGGYYNQITKKIGIFSCEMPEDLIDNYIVYILSHESIHKLLSNKISGKVSSQFDKLVNILELKRDIFERRNDGI